MVQKMSNELELNKPAYMYYLMTKSGQCSPTSDALDSGTGSDLETAPSPTGSSNGHSKNGISTSPASLSNAVAKSMRKFSDLSIDLPNGQQHRLKSRSANNNDSYNTDSEESESSLSCDSLNSAELLRLKSSTTQLKPMRNAYVVNAIHSPTTTSEESESAYLDSSEGKVFTSDENNVTKINFLPHSLLRDIRDRSMTATTTKSQSNASDTLIDSKTTIANIVRGDDAQRGINKTNSVSGHSDCSSNYTNEPFNLHQKNSHVNGGANALFGKRTTTPSNRIGSMLASSEMHQTIYENDKYISFHLNERKLDSVPNEVKATNESVNKDDDTFAGYKDIGEPAVAASTIRSSKGTIRGVKNRVRNGIATFLQMQQTNVKNYKEKDAGKVVLYSTSMGIVRETYAKCANVKQILRTLLIKFEERDVFMSSEYQQEIKDRMQSMEIQVPQLFVDGQHIGNADQVERLNESGELRQMLKTYKSLNSSYTCQVCGGYRLLPCPSCSGSKKSVHRNHFTTEFVALKCMNCDEVGLVKCYNCN